MEPYTHFEYGTISICPRTASSLSLPIHTQNFFPSYLVPANTSCAGGHHQYAPAPVTLIFDLLTLKVVSESRVTWATFELILVFLGLSVLDLGPIYTTTDVRQHHHLMPHLGAEA